MIRILLAIAALASTPIMAQQATSAAVPTHYQRAIAAGYKALNLCSGMFLAGRTKAQIEALELTGIYPEYDKIVPTLNATADRDVATVEVPFGPDLSPRSASLGTDGAGCVLAPIGSKGIRETGKVYSSGVRPIDPKSTDRRAWPLGDADIAPRPDTSLAQAVASAFAPTGPRTTGVVIVADGKIVAERYAEGFGPLVSNRTWSVAKSISGTLIGMAVADRAAEVGKPAPVPEWRTPLDPRRQITLDNLLRMASGLHSGAAGNRTDAIYFGGTAVTEEATAWPIEVRPGTRFRYANDDILLAVRSLRATLGEERYQSFPGTALFKPLGMTHTVAEQDWRGNFILSSQVWSTARDLARLGQFWLQDGVWQGKRLLPEGWMRYMTMPSGPQPADGPGYGATMWLFGPAQGLPEGAYAAQGNRGQYVFVIPSRRLVVVRRGEDPAGVRFDMPRFAADVIAALR